MENSTGVTVGDLEVSPRMFFSPTIFGKKSIVQVSVGASLPVGNSRLRDETNQRDFSSGTIDPVFSVALSSMLSHATNVFVSGYTRLGLGTADGRKAGSLYSASGGVTHKLFEGKLNVTVRSRLTHRQADVIDGATYSASGGRWFSLTPGVAAPLFGSGESVVRGWLELDVPVYQRVGGEQLSEKWSVAFGLNTSFALFGHSKPAGKHGGHLLKP